MATTPSKRLLYGARYRAKRDGLPFELTEADILVPRYCPALGIPLRPGGRHSPNSPSLDRIVPELGYVPGNVIVVSWRCNELKKNGTPDELGRIAAFYRQLTHN